MGILDKANEMKDKAEDLAEQAKDMASNVPDSAVVTDKIDDVASPIPRTEADGASE